MWMQRPGSYTRHTHPVTASGATQCLLPHERRPCTPWLRGEGCRDGKAGAEEDVSNSGSESQSRLHAHCSWAEAMSISLSLRHCPYHPVWGSTTSISQKGFPPSEGLQICRKKVGAVQRPHAMQRIQEPDQAGVNVAKKGVTWVQSRRCVFKSDPWKGFWGRMREKAIWAKKQVTSPSQHEK